MNTFAEALKGINLGELPEGEVLTEEQIENQRQIELAEGWLKLYERNASAKEKFQFAQKFGFLSETHLNLWMSADTDYHDKLYELEDLEGYCSNEELAPLRAEVEKLRGMAEAMKGKSYYRIVMRQLGRKDFSPYGEDLLKMKESGNSWSVDVEKTIKQGYISHKF